MTPDLQRFLDSGPRSAAEMREFYERYPAPEKLPLRVVGQIPLLDGVSQGNAASLLLHCARSRALDEETLGALVEHCDAASFWVTRLALCQIFARHDCAPEHRETLFPFLEESFSDSHLITRAWALSALARFRDDAEFRTIYEFWRERAATEEAPAMRARLRHLP
jgi:hypothetical protein